MNRVSFIGKSVLNILKHSGITDMSLEELYPYIQESQKQIIKEAECLEHIFDIELVTDDYIYPLSIQNRGNIIGKVKSIITPDSFIYPVEFVLNDHWNDYKKATYSGRQPLYITIIGSNFHVVPTPGASENTKVISIICELTNSLTDVSKTVEPEIEDHWDMAMVYFTAHQLVPEDKKILYKNLYNEQIADNSFRSLRISGSRPQGVW